MPQIRPRQILPLAALKLGAATSDRVDCGAGSSYADMGVAGVYSGMCLTTIPSVAATRRFFGKYNGTSGWFLTIGTANTNLRVFQTRATTNTDYVTSDGPLAKLNGWMWACFSMNVNAGAGLKVNIYSGWLGGTLSRRALTITTEGSGAASTDSTIAFDIGNHAAATPANAIVGNIALCAVWNRLVSFQEFARLTTDGGAGFRESNPAGMWRPGWQSAGNTVVHDDSGNSNHGTITGGVLSGPRVVL